MAVDPLDLVATGNAEKKTKSTKADDPAQETIYLVLELEMDERSGGYIVRSVVTGAPSRTS